MYQNIPNCISYCPSNNYSDYSSLYKDSKYRRASCNTKEMHQVPNYAVAYIPRQPYTELLPLNISLKRGSVFPNINLNYPRV